MNERIKQLAEQATAKISFRLDPNTYKHIDDPDGDLERFEFDKQKFAELIVRECMGLCYRIDTEYEGKKVKPTVIASKVAEHFGVEE